jgi:hypothetical protein
MVTGMRCCMLLAAWSAIACSGGCPTLEACDIRSANCQRDTQEVAACLRGGDAASVTIEATNAESFIEEQVRENTGNAETQDERDLRRGLALFALMPPSAEAEQTVREYWNRVAAFYSSEAHQITILDRGSPLDEPSDAALLLHELVHAMQRSDAGLGDEAHASTYDEGLAFRGVIEGEATLYEDLALIEGWGRDAADTDFEGIFGQYRLREWRRARANASPFELAWLRFPYAFGGDYVNRAWRAGGNAAVRDAFVNVPATSRQILAGYAAAAPNGLPWNEDPNELGKPILPPDFEHFATLHLGTWLFEVFRDLFGTDTRLSAGFSDSGFAGDVMTAFRSVDGDVVAVWRLRFGDAAQAAAMIEQLRVEAPLLASVVERDLIVVGDTRGVPLRSFVEGLSWEPATPEDWQASPRAAGALPRSLVTCGRASPSDFVE